MAPEMLVRRRKHEAEEEMLQERQRQEQMERQREAQRNRRNEFSGRTAQQPKSPQAVQEVKKEERVQPPPVPPPQVPASREASRGAQATSAPQPVEQRQTRETTRVEKLDLGHFDSQGKYEAVEGQSKVVVQELDKIERVEAQGANEQAQAGPAQEERAELQRPYGQARAEVVNALPLSRVITPISPEEIRRAKAQKDTAQIVAAGKKKEEAPKEADLVAQAAQPDSKRAGPTEKGEGEALAQIRRELDAAMKQNRPGLLVRAILDRREQEGPLDLMQIDEKKVQLLEGELAARIGSAQKARKRLLERIKNEKDASKRHKLRAQLKKIMLGLAFFSKIKGMLGRILGGFFGKLAGGLMK